MCVAIAIECFGQANVLRAAIADEPHGWQKCIIPGRRVQQTSRFARGHRVGSADPTYALVAEAMDASAPTQRRTSSTVVNAPKLSRVTPPWASVPSTS